MNSSPDNKHFICEKKVKSIQNLKTFTVCKYMMLLPGTLQSSKMSSAVLDPLMPSLSNLIPVLKPGVPCKCALFYQYQQ